ncbi:MAG: thioredoxin family protein [Candidatus Saccharibacteria bacterium]|nr:thioredoxin family protein [Candidatus Saccharibacteria bacterium]
MNRKILIGLAAFIATVAGGMFYLSQSETGGLDSMASTSASPSPTPTPPGATPAPETSESTPSGSYVNYTDDVIAQTSGTKILFFHAPWCPQCRALEADIQAKGVPSGVTIIKVDYDSNQSLRQKYGVTIQTSLVKIDDQANLVEKYVAYNDPSVASIIENLL